MESGNDRVFQFLLPPDLGSVSEWLAQFASPMSPDDLNRLVHYKNPTIPVRTFILWHRPSLMGDSRAWVLKDVQSLRTLWLSLGHGVQDEGWYFVDRMMALPFTDAPAF